jgi:S-(hydroxymethyl)glutathione dehydrogenase/alcohol dehydrogenase
MRAAVFRGSSSPVHVEDVQLAAPGPGEVRVQIAAAGVCHSDLHVRQGDWQLPTPLVLGHEGSGEIVETGPGVEDLAVGDHVVLSWVAPCGACRPCTLGQPVRCLTAATIVAPGGVLNDGTSRLSIDGDPAYHYLGVSSYAEQAVIPASGAVKVRADAPLEPLALVGCAVATGVGAVRNSAGVPPGAHVVVVGCGGVGLSVVQGARLAGADRIIAVDLRPEKTRLAIKLGATDEIDGTAADVVQSVKALLPDGADYAFDAIGGATTTRQCIDMLGVGGTAVVVGIPKAGTSVSFEPQLLVDFDQRIIGSNYGGIDPHRDIPQLVDLYMAGDLLLDEMISAHRPLNEAGASLDDLAAGATLRQLLIP